jgi:hypothetical protein
MDEPFAQLTSAVSCLADEFGVRVIVDGSLNSIPPELLSTNKETIFVVGPMSRGQIESIPEINTLMCILKKHNLDSAVWKVLGGSPTHYLKLNEAVDKSLSMFNTDYAEFVSQVKNYLLSILLLAFNKDVFKCSSSTKRIINNMRQEKDSKITNLEMKNRRLIFDYPNEVFREIITADDWYIEPASAAISLLISEHVENGTDVNKLVEKLFKEGM